MLEKKCLVCNATITQWSLECGNFELLLAFRYAPGYRMVVSFNWLLKTPFACKASSCPHIHTHTHAYQCLWLYTSVHFWKMLTKSYLEKGSALRGLLNSNGGELAWHNATVAVLVLPRGTGYPAKQRLCCLALVLVIVLPKGTGARLNQL